MSTNKVVLSDSESNLGGGSRSKGSAVGEDDGSHFFSSADFTVR